MAGSFSNNNLNHSIKQLVMKRLMIALLAICSFSAATFAQKQEKKKPAEQTAPAKKEKAAADSPKHAAHKAHTKKTVPEKKS